MYRKKRKIAVMLGGLLLSMILCAGMIPANVSVVYATNELGSQGSGSGGAAVAPEGEAGENGDSEGDAAVEDILNENADGVNTSSLATVIVNTASVRVRSEASTSASVAGNAKSGDTLNVTGETTGSDGQVWYQVTGESDGKAINGYVRSDLVTPGETASAPAPEETPVDQPEETPQEPAPTDNYYVQYAADDSGSSDWYLFDNVNGTRYKIAELLSAQQINAENQELMDKETGSLRMVIIILAVIIAIMVIVVTILIFKLRGSYDEDDDYGDDEDDDYGDEDDDEGDEDDEEETFVSRRKPAGGLGRSAARHGRAEKYPARSRRFEYDEDDEEDDEDDGEEELVYDRISKSPSSGTASRQTSRPASRQPERKNARSTREPEPARSRSKDVRSRNFLESDDDDDDMDFEFLDLK